MTKPYLWACALGALALGAAVLPAQADYKSTVLADGPLAYYRFSETVTMPVLSYATNIGSVGPAANGTFNGAFGGVPGALVGNTNTATTFGNGNVVIPYSAAINPSGPFTVECWANPNEANTGYPVSPFSSIFYNSSTAPNAREGWVIYQNGANGNTWAFRIGNSAGYSAIATGGIVTDGQWQHLVGVYDGANALLYVNGVLCATTATSSAPAPNPSQEMDIGTASAFGRWFGGGVDEAAVYPSALSAADILAHYQNGTNAARSVPYQQLVLNDNPLCYYRLDEFSNVQLAANAGSMGSAASGSYIYWSATTADLDSPTYPGFETTNTVLELSGTNGCVMLPALDLNTNTVTIESWVNLNGAQSPWAGFVYSRGTTANGLHVDGDGQELAYTWNNNNADTYNWPSGLEVPTNEWAYVALAIDPDEARLFLGTVDGGWNVATNAIPHDSEGFLVPAFIGQDPLGGRLINGRMDEVAIYNQTLTEGQLHTHLLGGLGGTNPPVLLVDPPVLTPTGTIYSTTPFAITADVYGQPPLSFQWIKDGTVIPGATMFT